MHMRFKQWFGTGLLGLSIFIYRPILADTSATITTAPARTAPATDTPEHIQKLKDIRKLLMLTNTQVMMQQVLSQIFDQFKQATPDVPDAFWTNSISEFNVDEVVNRIVPIYDKYYTQQDINGLI